MKKLKFVHNNKGFSNQSVKIIKNIYLNKKNQLNQVENTAKNYIHIDMCKLNNQHTKKTFYNINTSSKFLIIQGVHVPVINLYPLSALTVFLRYVVFAFKGYLNTKLI